MDRSLSPDPPRRDCEGHFAAPPGAASRIAWIVVIIVFPVIGILTYIFLGETSIGRPRVSRLCAVLAAMPDLTKAPGMDAPNLQPKIPETYAHLFRLGHSVNGFEPVGGNCATLLADSATGEVRSKMKFSLAQRRRIRFEGLVDQRDLQIFLNFTCVISLFSVRH